MASLEDLKAKVESLAEKITTLKKETPPNKEQIGSTVTELLNAKREYAKANNGIGVDGKPFEEPMSKAEKKKLEKAKKKAAAEAGAAAAAGGGGGGDSNVSFEMFIHVCCTCSMIFCVVFTYHLPQACRNILFCRHLNVIHY